ncbi:MAG TPA: SPOR domain-containing protein [Bacteroidota bacterium]|nr:SPOR domain-containing protein [Bacteroidota bacterium]
MPDLNLQDEGSLDNMEGSPERSEETTMTDEEPAKKGSSTTIILVVLAVLIVGGGGTFLLNKLGVIHLFGKKKTPTVVQLTDQAAPAQQQAESTQPAADAGQSAMIETPPVDQKGTPAEKKAAEKTAAKKGTKEKPSQPVREMPAPQSSGKLGDMKGEYTIQVSAWRDKEMAQEISKRLEEAGYPAYVDERPYKGGTWFTVRVGRYGSRKEAEAAVQNFAEEMRGSYWVDKAKAK